MEAQQAEGSHLQLGGAASRSSHHAVPKYKRPLVVASHASSLLQLGVTIIKRYNEGSRYPRDSM